ncbi:MAG: ABC transporter permease [Acidobacteria bacterium]|nr:ABC transporter permease [Acidobacteriota bacterium]
MLGTDIFGRDLFTRICYGARISLAVGLLGTFLTLLAGTFVGLLAAIAGGWMDSVCMEMTNFVLSLPTLFLLLALRALFPWEVTTVAIYLILVSILALTGWADVARMVRAKVLLMKSEEYVQAALAIGVSPARLIWRHLVPGLIPYWLVQGTLLIPAFLMSEVTLSFLGAGIPEPDASWGNILRQGLSLTVLTASPWILLPGIFIIGTAVSFNALADCLRRLTDTETA